MHEQPSREDIFMSGVVTFFALLILSLLCFCIYDHPLESVLTLGILFAIPFLLYFLGKITTSVMSLYKMWKNEKRMKELFYSGPTEAPQAYVTHIPTIDRLIALENKYKISTLCFVTMLAQGDTIKMDNLDYIEWLSLINDLSSLRFIENRGKDEVNTNDPE